MSALAGLRRPEVRTRVVLTASGVLIELLLLVYFVRQFPLLRYYSGDTDLGGLTGHSHAAFLQFISVMSALFVVLAGAWWVARKACDRISLAIILGFAALFAVTLVFVYPVTAIDLYAYVDQSLVLVHYHHNPISTPPAAFPSDPLMALSDGWQGSGSPYGPLGLVIDAIPALLFGRNLLANLIMLKLMFGAMGVGEAYAVYTILRRLRPEWALSGALLVAWNPLFLLEVGVNGHNDVAMMLFAVLGLASLGEDELMLGPVLIVASILVKYTTVVLLPPALVYAYFRTPAGRRNRDVTLTILACCGVAVLAYAPFWQGVGTVSHLLSQDQRHLSSFSSLIAGLVPAVDVNRATLLGRSLFVPIYVACLWLARRSFDSLLRACFAVMFFLLALAVTNFESWYVVWPVVLGACVPRLAERLTMVLMAYGAALLATFFGFVWVWYGLSGPGFTIADTLSYLLTFVPAAATLFSMTAARAGRLPADLPEDETVPRAVGG